MRRSGTRRCSRAKGRPRRRPSCRSWRQPGARLTGLRLLGGGLILRIEHGKRAILVRLARDGPLLAGGGLRLWHEFGLELPMAIARLQDLLGLVGGPAPRRGRGRWARDGSWRWCWR